MYLRYSVVRHYIQRLMLKKERKCRTLHFL
jgi:hypothetical protein